MVISEHSFIFLNLDLSKIWLIFDDWFSGVIAIKGYQSFGVHSFFFLFHTLLALVFLLNFSDTAWYYIFPKIFRFKTFLCVSFQSSCDSFSNLTSLPVQAHSNPILNTDGCSSCSSFLTNQNSAQQPLAANPSRSASLSNSLSLDSVFS